MTAGLMVVTLFDARDLTEGILFGGIDAYVVLKYNNISQTSKIAKGQGGNPVWNEKFEFNIEDTDPSDRDHHKLILKVLDHDAFSADDYLGQATIYLKDVVHLGLENKSVTVPPHKYVIVDNGQNYNGEIKVGITITAKGHG